jgi:DNA-directed RNA polymerase subunit RPC12/RpoP
VNEKSWLSSRTPENLIRWLLSSTKNERKNDQQTYHSLPPSDRKLRLYCCAHLRQVWDQLTSAATREAVLAAEQYADGKISLDALMIGGVWLASSRLSSSNSLVDNEAYHACHNYARYAAETIAKPNHAQPPHIKAALVREIIGNPFRPLPGDEAVLYHYVCKTCGPIPRPLLEEIRCPTCGENSHIRKYRRRDDWLRWRDGTVRRMAQAIYDARSFEDLPFMADALADAGCADQEMLRHLQGWERCRICLGEGEVSAVVMQRPENEGKKRCHVCHGEGWVKMSCEHHRGCWALDLCLGLL